MSDGSINQEIADLTDGEITSIDQVERIRDYVERNGHQLTSLNKRSVSAVLAHEPDEAVRCVLELRREGARASVRKLDRLLAMVDTDNRLRGSLRFHAAHTGRWSGRGYQPQNLKRPETKDLDAAVDAVLSGDIARVRELGAPLTIAGDVQRSVICAAPGHKLIAGDFSAIESRVLAWLADEKWKLETYREYDKTGDPKLEPYCVLASQALKRTVTPDDEEGRRSGRSTISLSASVADAAPGASSIAPTPTPTRRSNASSSNSAEATAQPFASGMRSSARPTAACASNDGPRLTIDSASTWSAARCS